MPMVLRRPSRICWQIGKTPRIVSYSCAMKQDSNMKSYNRKYIDIKSIIPYFGRKKVFKSLFFFCL